MSYNEVTSGVIRVASNFRADIGYAACYIILDEKIAIIDTGLEHTPKEEILSAIKGNGRNPKEVEFILLSHEHPDHIGAVNWLKKKTGAKVGIHKTAADGLRKPSKVLTQNFGLGGTERFIMKFREFDVYFAGLEADFTLAHKQIIKLGETKLAVIHSGGHSKSHLMFWDVDRNIVFVGDEVIEYPGDFYKHIIDLTGSSERREEALLMLMEINPKIICPVHDEIYMDEDVEPTLQYALDAHKAWDTTILDLLKAKRRPITTEEVGYDIKRILGVKWTETMEILENNVTARGHLEYLAETGKVVKIGGEEEEKEEEKKEEELEEEMEDEVEEDKKKKEKKRKDKKEKKKKKKKRKEILWEYASEDPS
ncbi:MAG: MBL fold metallo-hydrolase [Candidatus Hodarchaeota archaeon]